MAITQAVANSFKTELLKALHDFTTTTGHVFKIALYLSTATIGATTTVYSATGESSGTGYTAGGKNLANATGMPSNPAGIAFADFDDMTWSTSTITAAGALIYNSNAAANRAVVILYFGGDKSSSAGDFTVQFPTANDTLAIIRIA